MTRKQLTKPSRTRQVGRIGEQFDAYIEVAYQREKHKRYADYKPPVVYGSLEDFIGYIAQQQLEPRMGECGAGPARGVRMGVAIDLALWALLLAAAWGLCSMMGVG